MNCQNNTCGTTLTYDQARNIQQGHLNFYTSKMSFEEAQKLMRSVKQLTMPRDLVKFTTGYDPTYDPIPVATINKLVPRGKKIEKIRELNQLTDALKAVRRRRHLIRHIDS